MQRTEFVLGGCANYHYIDLSDETCFPYYYTFDISLVFPSEGWKILSRFFRSSKFFKHGNHSCCVASVLIFTFFSLEVLLLKLFCTISPKRKQWAHRKQPSPHLPTNSSSVFPLKKANVIILFAKRECEHICCSTHLLGTPSQCKLPQLTLCRSSTAHYKWLCLSKVLLFIYSPLSHSMGCFPALCSLRLYQVKKMSSSFGSSSPFLALLQPLVVLSLLLEADIYITGWGGNNSNKARLC